MFYFLHNPNSYITRSTTPNSILSNNASTVLLLGLLKFFGLSCVHHVVVVVRRVNLLAARVLRSSTGYRFISIHVLSSSTNSVGGFHCPFCGTTSGVWLWYTWPRCYMHPMAVVYFEVIVDHSSVCGIRNTLSFRNSWNTCWNHNTCFIFKLPVILLLICLFKDWNTKLQ